MWPGDGALMISKPDNIQLLQPGHLHQMWKPRCTEEADLTAVGDVYRANFM